MASAVQARVWHALRCCVVLEAQVSEPAYRVRAIAQDLELVLRHVAEIHIILKKTC